MNRKVKRILIVAPESPLRDQMSDLCSKFSKTSVAGTEESALVLLSRYSFEMLLIDQDLGPRKPVSFLSIIESLQPDAFKIALMASPGLSDVVTAIKLGMHDVFWTSQDMSVLEERIRDGFAHEKKHTIIHSHVSQLAESIANRAVNEKISLSRARKEFSEVCLGQLLKGQKLKRYQLAELMRVTPRTLYRYLLG